MKIRSYSFNQDGNKICTWMDDMRTHALWCANRFPFPLGLDEFEFALRENERNWNDCAFVAIDDNEKMIGFFCYSFDPENKVVFIKFFIISSEFRGSGFGSQMLDLALQYAREKWDAQAVQLNVFDSNTTAMSCYQRKGFIEKNRTSNAFAYKNEKWSRVNMWYYF